jgi:hypothetical protein
MIARIASHDIGVIAKRCVGIIAIEGSLVGVARRGNQIAQVVEQRCRE